MDLAGALELGERELVSFVGAGGKKTAMAALVATAAERHLRVAYATTTHVPPPDDLPLVLATGDELRDALSSAPESVAIARERVENPDRAAAKVRGHDPTVLDDLFERGLFDWVLVKADGARRREFKAPGENEPVIPADSTRVVPVASVRAVGEPLDERTVHRPDRVTAITGLERGAEITPRAVGTVLSSESGGQKGVPPGATVVPMVNKADTPAQREVARDVLETALDRTRRFDRGLVCSFERGFLEVVER